MTHRGDGRAVYTGVITSPRKMRLDPVKLERGDGIRFHAYCASKIRVSHLNVGSRKLSAHRVYLGASKVHPKHVPFTVHRIDAA